MSVTLQARAGIARAGAYRAGYFTPNVLVTIGGIDRSAVVARNAGGVSTATIAQVINDAPDTAFFTLLPRAGFIPLANQLVTIASGDVKNVEFAGTILSVTRRYERGTGLPNPWIDVACVDYGRLFDRRIVNAEFLAMSATDIANSLIDTFSSGFTRACVATGLPTIDDFIVSNITLSQALTQLVNLIDGAFYIDARRDVHLFGAAGDLGPKAGTNPVPLTTSLHSLKSFAIVSDGSQQRTRAIVEGKSTTCPVGTPFGGTLSSPSFQGSLEWTVTAGSGGQGGDGGALGSSGAVLTGTDAISSGSFAATVGAAGAGGAGGGSPTAGGAGGDSIFNGHDAAGGAGGAPGAVNVDYLIVGDGGGGAVVGGGGGGQVLTGTDVCSGSYAIVVGGGGSGAGGTGNGGSGTGSSFNAHSAAGGAGCAYFTSDHNGGRSGSGNGGGFYDSFTVAGGGGGGDSAGGGDAGSNAGGNGGAGTASSLSGSSISYGGGGGGYGFNSGGGGQAGGGNGATGAASGANGTANTGGGGGGGYAADNGGAGASGLVILRYLTALATSTGGSSTTSGPYTIVTFASSGTFVLTPASASSGLAGTAGSVVLSYLSGTITATGGTITTVGGRTIHTFTTTGTFVVSTVSVTSVAPVVTDLPLADASQIDPMAGTVRVGNQIVSYASISGAPIASGANPPGSTVSADTAAGATSIPLTDSSQFTAAPGWAQVGSQYVRFTGISGGSLTGIPVAGFGALALAVKASTQVSWLGQLNIAGAGVIFSPAVAAGASVIQRVLVDNAAAEATRAALEGGDGVDEYFVPITAVTIAGATARAAAEVTDFGAPIYTATWVTEDQNARPGRAQAIAIGDLALTLTITKVDVAFILPNYRARRTCTASTVHTAALLDAIVTGS